MWNTYLGIFWKTGPISENLKFSLDPFLFCKLVFQILFHCSKWIIISWLSYICYKWLDKYNFFLIATWVWHMWSSMHTLWGQGKFCRLLWKFPLHKITVCILLLIYQEWWDKLPTLNCCASHSWVRDKI